MSRYFPDIFPPFPHMSPSFSHIPALPRPKPAAPPAATRPRAGANWRGLGGLAVDLPIPRVLCSNYVEIAYKKHGPMVSFGDCNIRGKGFSMDYLWLFIPWGRGNFDPWRMMPLFDLLSFSHEKFTPPTGCGSLFRHRYAETLWRNLRTWSA